MGKHRFGGAPAAYSSNGQSRSARAANRPAHWREREMVRALHRNPKEIAAKIPRISWQEVLDQTPYATGITHPICYEEIETYFPEKLWHQAALALYDIRAPVASVRSAVEVAWIKHATLFMGMAGDELFPILRYCQFKVPKSFPDVMTIYRGTRGVDLETARGGLAWTLDRRVACTWAMHIGERQSAAGRVDGAVLVIRRTIRRDQVLFYSDMHEMAEVVFEPGDPAGEVDGDLADWTAVGKDYASALSFRDAYQRGLAGG